MTERKPAGMRFESWVERQVREAQERGEFDHLPGAGKPLPGLTGEYDELWWIKQLVRREHISALPPALALRKEAEDLLDGLGGLSSETAVRDRVDDYNARVVQVIRRPQEGPFLVPRRLDVDEVVAEWARQRAARTASSGTIQSSEPDAIGAQAVPRGAVASSEGQPCRWWHRLLRPGRQSRRG